MGLLDHWRAYRQSQKMMREWEEDLKGPNAFEAVAAGPDEWARMKRQREKEQWEVIESYSVKLFTLATEGADAIRKLSEDKTVGQHRYGLDREWFPVFTAFHSLYLHVTDREAFARAGDAGRYKVMKALVFHSIDVAVETVLKGMPPERLPGIKKECVEHLNWSNETYGQYKKLVPGLGESAESTASGRFGIEVAELAGRPGNSSYITLARERAMSSI